MDLQFSFRLVYVFFSVPHSPSAVNKMEDKNQAAGAPLQSDPCIWFLFAVH